MARLQLRCLGGLEISQGGQLLNAKIARKSLALVCYLAVSGQPQGRSTLASLLWSDFPEKRARSNLRDALSRLRRSVLTAYIDAGRQTIAFNSELPHWLDTAEFESGAHRAGQTQGETAKTLTAALSLYQGEFLAGFQISRAALFEEWVTVRRQHLHLLAIEALQQLVVFHLEAGSYRAGIEQARHLLRLDPWREGSHFFLVKLMWLAGDHSGALKQFNECCQILADELGVAPSPETRGLYEIIRRQHTGSAKKWARRDLVRFRAARPILHNLPSQSTPFIGRELERQQLDVLIRDPANRLITIWGQGGIGKTRLALAAAEQQCPASQPGGGARFPDGIFFVPLQGLDSAADLIPAMLQTLHAPPSTAKDKQSEWQQLLEFLGPKQLLLIMDNFEHLQDGGILLANVLQACPHIQLLITSRELLRLYEEQRYPLAGLPYPAADSVMAAADARQYAAVQLFLERARRIQPSYRIAEEELPHVLAICQMVQGIPLAVELAAGLVDRYSLAAIANLLEQSSAILVTDQRNVPSRHRSMEQLFDSAWNRLSRSKQEIMGRLSLCQGGFTEKAALAVAQASRPQLFELVNRSLLLYDQSNRRFHLHRLLQQYGLARLSSQPVVEIESRDRYSHYFCQAAARWGAQLKGPDHNQGLARLRADRDNLRSAWRWACCQGDIPLLAQTIDGLCHFYETRGDYRVGAEACQRLEEGLPPAYTPPDLCLARLRLTALIWQINFCRLLGQTEATVRLLSQVESLLASPGLRGQDMRPERAFLCQQQGQLQVRDGRWDEAKLCFQESVALFQALGGRWPEARSWQLLGRSAFRLADYDEARQAYQQSLRLLHQIGDATGEVRSLAGLACVASYLGHYDEAENSQRQAIKMLRQLGDIDGLGHRIRELALTLMLAGRFAEALAAAEQSVEIHQRLGARRRISSSMLVVGMNELHLGRFERARKVLQEALGLVAGMAAVLPAASELVMLGNIDLVEGDEIKAQQQIAAGVAQMRASGLKWELSWALVSLALGWRALGSHAKAHQCIRESLQISSQIQSQIGVCLGVAAAALLRLAEASADNVHLIQVAELFALAERSLLLTRSRWFEAVMGSEIQRAIARLDPRLRAASREAGRTRDPWLIAATLLDEGDV